MISTRPELMTSRQCLRLAYVLVVLSAVASCAFGCVQGNYVRGDYIVVHADAETSGTITIDNSRTNPPSIWSVIFGAIANLWR